MKGESTREADALASSAPLALRLAPRLCDGCAWFHGIWQVLRLLRLNTTPEHHARFFRRWLAPERAGFDVRRVLISGAADYSMLAHILPALSAKASITVLDRCETPLALTRWYARRHSVAITTKRSDILDFRPRQRFDAICTHSFLGQFTPRRRAMLLARWKEMLRPGGLVLTVNRLRPGAGPGRVGFSPGQARHFERLLAEKAERVRSRLGVEPSRLARMARQYARRMGAWPIRDEKEIADAFRAAGFEIEQLSAGPVVLRAGGALSAPTTPGGARYACIAARRP